MANSWQWTLRYFCATAAYSADRLDGLAGRGERDMLVRAARDFSGAANELGFWELAAFAASVAERAAGASIHPIEPAVDAVRRIAARVRPHHSALWTGEIEAGEPGKKYLGVRRMLGRAPVLIVDADSAAQAAIHAALTDAGAREFMLASHFDEAAAIMQTAAPGLVIADLRSKAAGGCDLVCLLRSGGCAAPADTPLIVLAPEGEHAKCGAALRSGADYMLLKPFARDALLNAVRVALTKRDPARAA